MVRGRRIPRRCRRRRAARVPRRRRPPPPRAAFRAPVSESGVRSGGPRAETRRRPPPRAAGRRASRAPLSARRRRLRGGRMAFDEILCARRRCDGRRLPGARGRGAPRAARLLAGRDGLMALASPRRHRAPADRAVPGNGSGRPGAVARRSGGLGQVGGVAAFGEPAVGKVVGERTVWEPVTESWRDVRGMSGSYPSGRWRPTFFGLRQQRTRSWPRLRPRQTRLWSRLRPWWTRSWPRLRPLQTRSWPRLRPRQTKSWPRLRPLTRVVGGFVWEPVFFELVLLGEDSLLWEPVLRNISAVVQCLGSVNLLCSRFAPAMDLLK